jgi:hypothetical protein
MHERILNEDSTTIHFGVAITNMYNVRSLSPQVRICMLVKMDGTLLYSIQLEDNCMPVEICNC